ncbi:unnamed protein product [Rotaria sordida]|uniref:Uncharacterized protein n=1 Tax=Rotaria sordida TaxID=392033 RepID=A0A819N3W5_9BILA|nr:unnamed protein product [Rotaria sordida]
MVKSAALYLVSIKKNVDYYVTNLTAGRSLDNTTSIICNIHHKQALNIDVNEVKSCSTRNTLDSSFTLDQIDWSTMENGPQNLNFEKWQETFSKYFSFDSASDPETSAIFDKHQHHISDVLYEMIKLVHEIQKTDSEKPVNIEDEDTQETLENEELKDSENEDMDEHLHLQNLKTDL